MRALERTLGATLKRGFDYAEYCGIIGRKSWARTEKEFALALVNPDATLTGIAKTLMHLQETYMARPEDQAEYNRASDFYPAKKLEAGHPLHAILSKAWSDTLQHYAKEVATYDQKFPAQGKAYPHIIPTIKVAKSSIVGAEFLTDEKGRFSLAVTTSFLQLPVSQQAAAVYHECHHAISPVLAGDMPQEYLSRLGNKDKWTFNAAKRGRETDADRHAVHFCGKTAMEEVLRATQKSQEPVLYRIWNSWRYDNAVLPDIYDAARTSGFAFDPATFEGLSTDDRVVAERVREEMNAGRISQKQKMAGDAAASKGGKEGRFARWRDRIHTETENMLRRLDFPTEPYPPLEKRVWTIQNFPSERGKGR